MKSKLGSLVRQPQIRFILLFIGIIALYYLLVLLLPDSVFQGYIDFTARSSSWLMSLFLDNIKALGPTIWNDEFSVVLSFGCEGTEPLVIYFAGIMAYPMAWKQRVTGLLIGLPFLYILNMFRIYFLFLIGIKDPSSFVSYHETIFPLIFIILAFLLWGLWIRFVSGRHGSGAAAA